MCQVQQKVIYGKFCIGSRETAITIAFVTVCLHLASIIGIIRIFYKLNHRPSKDVTRKNRLKLNILQPRLINHIFNIH